MTKDNSDSKEVDKKEKFQEITKDVANEIEKNLDQIKSKLSSKKKKRKRSLAGKKAAETRKKNKGNTKRSRSETYDG